ncbi:GNAT family N-acetyltransferase [Gracilibacillus oryzae]|uniref:GNAT family N-acetyltransferase n=1 Tax=Gracilibacillus oryzae TaxID=1672701 RepID=A0A7C8L4X7_9BACI|nr:GNAT family N-acetyltransferase [Gracilibacillus oryzae]KAB8138152.1 GNAT family N-acetyltransferase [Gracilibacillus oryzae]
MTSFVNKKLANMIEKSEIDALTSRLSAIQKLSGNPMKVEIETFGNATAFSVKNIPGPSYNTVKGLEACDEPFLKQIIEFYKQKDIPVRFELTPANTSPELFTSLHQSGYYQVDFHTSLYKEIDNEMEKGDNSTISIQELREQEFDIFADVYTQGFHMPAFLKNSIAQNNQILYNSESWTFYLASINNEPAGIGVLFKQNNVANLAAAATLPAYRNKGIQSALIGMRIHQAFMENCKLITGQAKFGSVSQNNMERAGMRIAYTKAIWEKR